jgi:hypothetical protein
VSLRTAAEHVAACQSTAKDGFRSHDGDVRNRDAPIIACVGHEVIVTWLLTSLYSFAWTLKQVHAGAVDEPKPCQHSKRHQVQSGIVGREGA